MRPALPIACCALLLLGSCGAGILGIAASSNNGGSSSPEVRAPELSLVSVVPLVPAPNTTRTVVVANAQIAATSRLRVRIEAAGVGVDQRDPTAVGQGGSTSIAFVLETAAILAAAGTATADVPGTLLVLVDDGAIASAPVVLARQPQATLATPGGPTFLSPFGQQISLLVDGLRSTEVADLQVLVRTPDPSQVREPGGAQPTLTRLCTALELLPGPAPGVRELRAVAPGNGFPTGAELFVRDELAGESTVAAGAYYRPDIALALPSQGPTTGGSLVTLVGTALVPYDFRVAGVPPPLRYDAVSLSFAKGGRAVPLAREDFRAAESSRDRLVFTIPASPDGRPGQVDIVLDVALEGVVAQVTASQVFLFANPQPFFGPRGTTLDRLPVAVAPIALDAAPSGDDAPDFAALYDEAGVAFLQLLLAQENGMFTRFGAPRQIADHEVAAELGPRDLCAGDFDGDAVPDMFLVNAGAATAVHHLVLGQAKPQPPLGAVHRFPAAAGSWRCRAADFDRDGLADLLLVPGPGAPAGQRPEVWLARPVAVGQPAFVGAPLAVRSFAYQAVEVADLDGDGALDIALVSGASLQMDVAFGVGDGTFAPAVQVDFAVPGYTPDPLSPAVGLHGCRNGVLQSLAIVLAGLESTPIATGPTRPTVAVLHQTAPRSFLAPTGQDVEVIPTEPLAVSLAADLDQANTLEMALAVRGDPQFVSLGLLRYSGTRFVPVLGGIELGAESPRQIRSLHFDRAFPATANIPEAKAVFVVHESEIDGARERRLSTRLLYSDPQTQQLTLLPPDAGAQIGTPIESIVGGNFHAVSVAAGGSVRDLALARAGAIELLENDGFGGFPKPTNALDWAGLLPDSTQLLPSELPEIEGLVFANADSRLGLWRHDPAGAAWQSPTAVTTPLRALITDPVLQSAALSDRTQLQVADVDGDGVPDLVALLCFVLPQQGEGDARLALLRGNPAAAANEFPFLLPAELTPVHGNSSSIALGDFVAESSPQSRRLELAVAVPRGAQVGALDGNHVRFFRYVPGASPAEDRFAPSARAGGPQVLLAGSGPTRLVAADFDRDDLVDLLVAAANDSTLRLYRNTATGFGGEVDVGAFHESLGSPRPLAAGEPRALRLGDVNGDGRLDAIAAVEWTSAGNVSSTSVLFYLSTGAGEFATPDFVSPTRVGDRDAQLSLDLGDWNRDGVLDLFLGWDTAGPSDRNVRVLFGGTR